MKGAKGGRGLRFWRGSTRADGVYERFVTEYLSRAPIEAGDDFADAVAKQFRDGSARAC